MKHIGKRVLSMMCALVILLSLAGMIVPSAQTTEDASTNAIDAIPSAHLVSVRDHSTFATDASQGTTYVDDTEAYGGKVVCYAKTPLNSSSFITVKRYDNGKELTIGNLPLEKLKVNAGYQIYQFTYAVPADATEGGVFFIMNNWQLNSKDFCADFAPYAGKTVEVYVSLKVTGPADDGNYSVYVDRVALATVCEDYLGEDGATCTLCGEGDKLLSMISGEHLVSMRDHSTFATDANNGTTYVDDADAYGGKAVCYAKTPLNSSSFITVKRYDNGKELTIGNLPLEKLKVNAGYQIYQFTYAVPADATEGGVFFIMNNWQLNSKDFCADFAPYAGKTVEVYLSIKVTGPADDGNYSVYVDRVALASVCADYPNEDGSACTQCGKLLNDGTHEHSCTQYTYIDAQKHTGTCSGCGEVLTEKHTWNSGVITVAPTIETEGEKIYTCTVCEGTKTEVLDMLQEVKLPLVFRADDLTLPYSADSVVEDADSQYGKAAMLSYTARNATGSEGLVNAMIFGSGEQLKLFTYDGTDSVLVGAITAEELQANAAAGQYATYTFEAVELVPTGSNVYLYMFDCWGLKTQFNNEQLSLLEGKLLDVTVSMKVTGDVTGTTDPPAFYIDSITFAAAPPNEINSIHSEHRVSIRDYSCFATDANSGTTYVDDADAHNGKAVCYAKTPLDASSFISIKRYDNGKELTIGNLPLEELKVNAGYQIYQFTYDVPADATQGGVFFIMNNWQLNSAQFCKDFAAYAGKTVEVFISMKVTGPSDDGYYSVYVDRVALATVCEDYASDDGVYCTLCGKYLQAEEGKYALVVIGPSGTVYPYQDSVKEYLLDNNLDILSHYEAGTKEFGDASIAPVCIKWTDSEDPTITRYVVEYATKKDYSDAIVVEKDALLGEKEIQVYNLYKGSTYYVRITAYAGDTVLGQAESTFQTTDLGPRFMNIDGLYNVRDLGGYKTADGKITVQGMIYRGSEGDGENGILITQAGNDYMSNVLNIKTDMDLRGSTTESPISSATKLPFRVWGYEDAFSQTELHRALFASFADINNYPVYIHCHAGADRTGTICYLLNALLGVSEEDLIRDYEITSYSIFGERVKDNSIYPFADFVDHLKTYEGDTLQEKTENYMLSIGVTEDEISRIRQIMLEEPQTHTHTYTDYTYTNEDQHTGTCSGCGETVSEDHTWDSGVVTLEPTTEAEGEKTYTCSVCNGTKTEVLEKLKPETEFVPGEHLLVMRDHSYFATDANAGTTYVDDADAYGGKAVCYAKTPLDASSFITIKRYDNGEERTIGNLPIENLKVNAGYQVYKFTYDVPADTTQGGVFFMMNNWQLNSAQFCKDFAPYAGQTVEVYLSIKVTGPFSDGYYSVSVDRVALASVCQWDDGVVTVKPTTEAEGKKTYTCTVCNATRTEVVDKLGAEDKFVPSEHLLVMRDHSAFATDANEGTTYVDDADAYGDKAVCYSKAKLDDSNFITINRYDVASGLVDGDPKLKIGGLALGELAVNAGYQVYKFTYEVPAETTGGNVFYIMSN